MYIKKSITTALLLLLIVLSNAQAPNSFNYQTVIRNGSGKLLKNQAVSMKISILEKTNKGNEVYVEYHKKTTNNNGLINLNIGEGTVISGVFNQIKWANNIFFIKTDLDVKGGKSYSFMGTQQLLSVPYSLYAAKANHAITSQTSLTDRYKDGDTLIGNEFQNLSINNNTLSLSDGNTVNLPIIENLSKLKDVDVKNPAANTVLVWNGKAWVAGDICTLFSFRRYFADTDKDGFGDANTEVIACNTPKGYVLNHLDCNDKDSTINPNTKEICNNIDDNCDGTIDEGYTKVVQYTDNDGDGYGDSKSPLFIFCTLRKGYSANNLDCDDKNGKVNPGAKEICNNIDDNCNKKIDEGTLITQYTDNDGDRYGDKKSKEFKFCTLKKGYSKNKTDCDDNNKNINPGAKEICNNGKDDNCNGKYDEQPCQ